MPTIKHTFMVIIEIDTELAKPCPDSAGEQAKEYKGKNHKAYPDWETLYQGREYRFVNDIWSDFRSCLKYDGLRTEIFEVDKREFSGFFEADSIDKICEARYLIEFVHDDIYPETYDPPSEWEKERIEEFENTFSGVIENLEKLRVLAEDEDNERERKKGATWQ